MHNRVSVLFAFYVCDGKKAYIWMTVWFLMSVWSKHVLIGLSSKNALLLYFENPGQLTLLKNRLNKEWENDQVQTKSP